jgi:hypothetical protein
VKAPSIVKNTNGLTLFEIILTIFILGVAVSAMIEAFTPSLRSTEDYESTTVFVNQVRSTLNRIAALDYNTLNRNKGNPVNLAGLFGTTAEAAKEKFNYMGTTYTPKVAIIDASGGSGGLLELNVLVERVSLKTLRTDD